ncbi:MAG: DUF4215 domain-containing protein, partial [Myxococcaceae bacterium]|nr:DUF4215 domain-containing protein [Myxococcaceae bacterium]
MRRLTATLAVLSVSLFGCPGPSTTDGGSDAGLDAGRIDSGTAGGNDAGRDAGPADSGTPDAGVSCGDAIIGPGEACDDGATDPNDGCSATCAIEPGWSCVDTPSLCTSGCGDGIVVGAEGCDDGDLEGGDGCSATCSREPGWSCTGMPSTCGPTCGDGVITATEACDDMNVMPGDGCSAACAIEAGFACMGVPSACTPNCGDGERLGAETCDDGNQDPNDGCSPVCTVEPGYQCSTAAPNVCVTVCGDGVRRGTEACDDGNVMPGDGCTGCVVDPNYSCNMATPNVCGPTCGDNLIIAPETCDDGNPTGNDGCSGICRIEAGYVCAGLPSVCTKVCGDGLIVGAEECDDSGTMGGDGCSATCTIEPGFECAGIPSMCSAVCGDGVRNGAETCDDGDRDPFDGCSAICQVESGFACSGSPSTCSAVCGDGIVMAGEACDDGNMNGSDGCVSCAIQPGYSCAGQPSVCTTMGAVTSVSLNGVGNDNGHGCLTTSSGLVFCWGFNTDGQVGDGTTVSPVFTPVQVPLSNVVEVACSETTACALTDAGTVSCWGDNLESALGQPGRATATDSPFPLTVPGVSGAVELKAGDDFICARLGTGEVMCWGDNDNRQLGRGGTGTTDSDTAALVPGLSTATKLAPGGDHICVMTAGGGVSCWGDAASGQQGNDAGTVDVSSPTAVTSLSNIVDLASGTNHTCALNAGGQVYCWGGGANGRLGNGGTANQTTPQLVPSLTGVTHLAAGSTHNCVVNATGEVWCWGGGARGQIGNGAVADVTTPVRVTGLPASPTQLDLGEETSCALYANGSRWCWGMTEDGQLGMGAAAPLRVTSPAPVTGLGSVVTLATTKQTYRYGHACAVTSTDALYCWGDNLVGELGDGTNLVAESPRLVTAVTGPVRDVAVTMQSTGTAIATSIQTASTCALMMTGEVLCWGGNSRGMLGDGTTTGRVTASPAAVGAIPVTAITAGQDFYCTLHDDGSVRCWGDNTSGQLAQAASTTPVSTPVLVAGLPAATQLVAGEDHVCALTMGGTVYCWGEGGSGQL